MQHPRDDLVETLRAALDRLELFAGILDDAIGRHLRDALAPGAGGIGSAHLRRLTLALVTRAELAPRPIVGDAFTDWLLDRLLDDRNVLATKLDRAPNATIGEAIRRHALHELSAILELLHGVGRALAPGGAPWEGVAPLVGEAPETDRTRDKAALLAAPDPTTALAALLTAYRRGTGLFGRSRGFRWSGGELRPVEALDLPRLEALVGYDRERAPVVRNTAQFVAGLPANDVLIAGARGTGKSSTIKALLRRFGDRGLRLVEVAKTDLGDLPTIVERLRPRHERFILFIDDLSFEADESAYKGLKALLEGTVEARPGNVLVYATSNRRNLIAERWSERADDAEVHPRERHDEKLSLVDRFGVRVFFPAPDQQLYLRIVEALAAEAGLTLPVDELRQRALRWELQHSGRSGRLARQFVTSLLGELAG
jgi:predicted AAA+ superfamily ATPase